MSDVERYWRSNKKTSVMHLLEIFGIDTFSPKTPRPLPLGWIKRTWRKAKRFDRKTLGLLTYDEHKKLHGEDTDCKCPIDKGRNITEFYDVFTGAELLKEGLSVHESFSSFREFHTGRRHIFEQDFKDYMKSKRFIKEALKTLGIDLNQKTLF